MIKGIVCVVDDERDVVKYHSGILSAAGYEVKKLYSVDQVLEYLRENVPLCIVSDDNIGNTHGIEILEEIAAFGRLSKIGFVMVSGGKNDVSLVDRIKDLQGEYLSKPVDGELLIKVVEDQIKLHKPSEKFSNLRLLQ